MQYITSILKKHPLMVSLVSNTCKALAADFITQKVLEKRHDIDRRRSIIFATFGLVYLGGWQHFLFTKLFSRVESVMCACNIPKIYQSCALTYIDLGLHTPFMYYPAFYTIKCIAENKTFIDLQDMYKNNIQKDLVSLWKLWIPVQIINFRFLPLFLRMPFITSVSFLWTMILSSMHGST